MPTADIPRAYPAKRACETEHDRLTVVKPPETRPLVPITDAATNPKSSELAVSNRSNSTVDDFKSMSPTNIE
ncbi:MAG: uncharacterized protein KVP18_001593 [Porospora cf. gigantea A]|uniref:uncharacterized protein n=1 Tax=Porospora cf. gigantea A TaxID=2853593 RepID=UPI00355A2483|nr:MAG: hypothetical protein KVP18_001593 [Porospora cf. gigantea A]